MGLRPGDGSGIYRREHVLEMPLRMPESLPMTRYMSYGSNCPNKTTKSRRQALRQGNAERTR